MRATIGLHKPTPTKVILTITAKPIKGTSYAKWLEGECFRVLGRDEMVTRGGRWRWRIGQDPEKLTRILADLKCCQREGKHVRNPGAYAEDLWKRFA